MTKIERLKVAVRETCRQNNFYSDTALRHLFDTAERAKVLAEKVGADAEICWLAGLLHDIGAIESGPNNHHNIGAEIAGQILRNLSYPEITIQKVCYCIRVHRGSLSLERRTLEAKVVASADAMSHFGTVSELINAARHSLGKSPEQAIEWTRAKLERSYNKLMPEARFMAQEAYEEALRELSTLST